MSTSKVRNNYWLSFVAVVISFFVFIVPFIFIVLTAIKDEADAAELRFSWPRRMRLAENFREVVGRRDGILVRAFFNSTILTVASVSILVVVAALVAFVLQRRRSRWTGVVGFLVLAGLIIPPAVVPTIWVLKGLHLFKTLPGLVLIEVAFHMSFCVLLFRAFVATIPRELDEAATIDGAGPVRLFFSVIFPLLRSVIVTVIVILSVSVFNDFTYPLYFLPGEKNSTVQLTLYNFLSQNRSEYNLLYMNILLITIPPLIMFLFFNRRIVAGMTAGAVKG